MTTDNVGRQIAFVLNDEVFSAPNVNEPIPNGQTSISGGFDNVETARDLARLLSIGRLTCPVVLLDERLVNEGEK
jgi:preprotein translocase subunit SecD